MGWELWRESIGKPYVRPVCRLEAARPLRHLRRWAGIGLHVGAGGSVLYWLAYCVLAGGALLMLAPRLAPGAALHVIPAVLVAGALILVGDAAHEAGHAVADLRAGATDTTITLAMGAHVGSTFPPGEERTTWGWLGGVAYGAGYGLVLLVGGLGADALDWSVPGVTLAAAAAVRLCLELGNSLPIPGFDGWQFWRRLARRVLARRAG